MEIKKPTFDISRFQVVEKNRTTERGEMLEMFLDKLNPARIADGYKPYTIKRIAVLLAHIPTDDLYAFYRQCETSDLPFGAKFHYELKPRK